MNNIHIHIHSVFLFIIFLIPGWKWGFAFLNGKLNISLTQLSLGYCLINPNVSTVILGATKLEQLKENLGTLSIVDKITDSTIKDINKVLDK